MFSYNKHFFFCFFMYIAVSYVSRISLFCFIQKVSITLWLFCLPFCLSLIVSYLNIYILFTQIILTFLVTSSAKLITIYTEIHIKNFNRDVHLYKNWLFIVTKINISWHTRLFYFFCTLCLQKYTKFQDGLKHFTLNYLLNTVSYKVSYLLW